MVAVPGRRWPLAAGAPPPRSYRPHTGFPDWTPSDDPREVVDEAFVYACRNGRLAAMGFLLERVADLDAPYRGTGLIWAAGRRPCAGFSTTESM